MNWNCKDERGRVSATLLLLLMLFVGSASALAQAPPPHVTVGGNIYGGGALANVDGNSTVLIDQEGVVIDGNVFGGGLGQLSAAAVYWTAEDAPLPDGVSVGDLKTHAVEAIAALVEGNVTVTVNYGTIGAVFGCNDVNGTPKGSVEVTINGSAATIIGGGGAKTYAIGAVYGGGNLAHYDPTTPAKYPVVTINGCNTSVKDVFGGGNAAAVPYDSVVVNGGDIDRVFAGGNGESGTPANIGWKNTDASPSSDNYGEGKSFATIKGGTINQVFGGSNANGKICVSSAVTIEKNGSCAMHIGDVYGGGNEAPGGVATLNIVCTGSESEGIVNVYGGANAANVTGDIVLNITGGRIDNAFGGNNATGTISGDITVNVNWNGSCAQNYLGNVYGGGNLAAYSGIPEVNIINGTVSGKVYGGGNEANVGGSTVNITGGEVSQGVYGGCNNSGTVTGNITVSATGGDIGTDDGIYTDGIFGGGYGVSTATEGNVTVTVNGSNVYVYGDIYGGSALGSVNDAAGDLTTVNILDGTINGNIYGGGLGEENNATKGTVNGKVTVNIGATTGGDFPTYSGNATINGEVFGCNNSGGSPKDSVKVNIYKTAHNGSNGYPSITTLADLDALVANPNDVSYPNKFAISAVYGGGNKASYIPATTGKSTTVHIYGCTENTIQTVYGGGNAADVGSGGISANTNVIIDGGFIDRVFGGGNGYSVTGNHTLPYYDDVNDVCTASTTSTPCPDYNPGANIYGTATTTINGGLYRQVFGGNNQYGGVTTTNLSFIKSGCDVLLIDESFGGANEAEITGDVTTNLLCSDIKIGNFYGGSNLANITGNVTLNVYGGTYINVFGGSKGRAGVPANITGTVTLNLFGGTMVNAFGGSDVNGNITGKITVNVLDFELENCGLVVNNIYGGGQDAAYTPNTPGLYPEVNLIHGTADGNVFGGGLGEGAVVTSSPIVTIGYDASTMGDPSTSSTLVYTLTHIAGVTYEPATTQPSNYTSTVTGDVYGGGNAAAVTGHTKVTVNGGNAKTTAVLGNIYGGGNAATVTGDTKVIIK